MSVPLTLPVMIVDDDPEFCDSSTCVLAARGDDIHVATSVEAEQTSIRRRPRGLAILDMRLNGEMMGLDVMNELQTCNPVVTIVLVSGFREPQASIQPAGGSGAVSYLTKPLDFEALFKTIGDSA